MFSFRRVFKFWGRLLAVLIPFYAVWVLLVLIALQSGEWPIRGWQLGLKLTAALALATLIIVVVLALSMSFMQKLYALKNRREVFWYLVHRLFGQVNFRPYILVEEGKDKINDPDSLLVKVGGPGNMVIRKDSAVVLERAGRLTRVEGAGFPKLKPFERVYDIIDLRPLRWQFPVVGMSKEGIPVICETDIMMQIQSGGELPSGKKPFPMDPNAVFVASTSKWIREVYRPENDRVIDWKGLIVISATEGTLRSILARYPLDRLIGPESLAQEHPRRAICRELEEALHAAAARVGAKILKVELGQIKVEDAVTQQWIECWQAAWQRWATEYLATGEAEYMERVETAHSEVVAKRIRDIANVLHELNKSGGYKAFVTGAKLQLQLAMRNAGADSLAMTYMPREALSLLQITANLPLPPKMKDTDAP